MCWPSPESLLELGGCRWGLTWDIDQSLIHVQEGSLSLFASFTQCIDLEGTKQGFRMSGAKTTIPLAGWGHRKHKADSPFGCLKASKGAPHYPLSSGWHEDAAGLMLEIHEVAANPKFLGVAHRGGEGVGAPWPVACFRLWADPLGEIQLQGAGEPGL